MDLETIQAASRIDKFREGELRSPVIQEQLDKLKDLSNEEKEQLMVEAFKRALPIAEALVARPEYDEHREVLDLTEYGLGKIELDVYHDDGEDDVKPYDGISIDVAGLNAQHNSIGDLNDDMVYVNRDGTVPDFYGSPDQMLYAMLEYLETLEVIQEQLGRIPSGDS